MMLSFCYFKLSSFLGSQVLKMFSLLMNILTIFRKLAKYRKVRLSNISCVCMDGVNDVYVCMCMGACVCTNTWRPQDDVLS